MDAQITPRSCGNDQQSIVYHEAARTDFLAGLGQKILPQH